MTTLEQIKAIIADQAGIPASDVEDDANLREQEKPLDFDSLDHVELVIAVEEHFNIEIPDDDAAGDNLDTPEKIAAYIDQRLDQAMRDRVDAHQVSRAEAQQLKEKSTEPPITREEVLRRGVAEGEGMALNIAAHLGWPTEDEPMGRDATHVLISHEEYAALVKTADDTPAVIASGLDGILFRKKPVEIEAVEFKGIEVAGGSPRAVFNRPDVPQWLLDAFAEPEGEPGAVWTACSVETCDPCWSHDVLKIGTVDPSIATAYPGDWILRGTSGELYPCKPDIFAATYDPATPVRDCFSNDEEAKRVYDGWSDMPGWVPWVDRGNSDMQEQARLAVAPYDGSHAHEPL